MSRLFGTFNNLKISWRIAIACLIPLLALTGFAANNLWQLWEASQSAGRVMVVIEASPAISGLIHELQRERGASVAFVNSKGQALGDVMRTQRSATDKAAAAWQQQLSTMNRAALGSKFNETIDASASAMSGLAATRSGIDALSLPGAKTGEYYSSAIARLIGAIQEVSEKTDDARINRHARVVSAFIQRKEFAGQVRATGAPAFAAGEFTPEFHQNFVRVVTLQDSQA